MLLNEANTLLTQTKPKKASKLAYKTNPEKAKEASKLAYKATPEKVKEASKSAYKANLYKAREASKKYYVEKKAKICKSRRDRYVMHSPKDSLIKQYVNGLTRRFLSNPEIKLFLTMQFNRQMQVYAKALSSSHKAKMAYQIAAKKLVYETLALCKTNAGLFKKYVRFVNAQTITKREDFGKTSHSVASEPFYYETAYKHLLNSSILTIDHHNRFLSLVNPKVTEHEFAIGKPIIMDQAGRAHLSEILATGKDGKPKQWSCSVADQ